MSSPTSNQCSISDQ